MKIGNVKTHAGQFPITFFKPSKKGNLTPVINNNPIIRTAVIYNIHLY